MKRYLLLVCMFVIVACVTSPLGRRQLMIVSDAQMDSLGEQAFKEFTTKDPIETDAGVLAYVQCVVAPLVEAAKGQTSVERWDVVVFKKKEANAFALPGGKIGVYSGLLEVAATDAQLATVIGHEIGHVIARHSAERVSQQTGSQLGLATIGALSKDNPNRQLLMGLLGVGLQVGVLLPFSRIQENEADLIGLDLMARAGFDPQQSVELWKNMMRNSQNQTPQWLSTHPAGTSRIDSLHAQMPEAEAKFRQAKAEGRAPHCKKN